MAAASTAADSPPAFTDYRITSWTGGDGITLGEVKSIAQDHDGYIWLASDGGLVRFDGFHFAATDLVSGGALPRVATRAVHVADDGSLWIGYGEGRGIYHIVRGELRETALQNQIDGFINAIAEDRSGAIWVAHDGGLHRFRDGRWEQIFLPDAGTEPNVRDVHQDRAGVLWVATTTGLYRQNASGMFQRDSYSGRSIGVSEDRDGHVWVTDEDAGFRRAGTDERNVLFKARGMDLLHDSRGNLWVTTVGQGIWLVQNAASAAPTVRRLTAQSGLLNDENSNMLEDRDGNIWIASIEGLTRFTPRKATSIVDLGIVRAITLGPDGTVWAGTTTGLVALKGATSQSRADRHTTTTPAITALHTTADGTVWAATKDGLNRVVNGALKPVRLAGPRLRSVSTITSDRTGTLWLCEETLGVVRIVGNRVEPFAAATNGIAAKPLLVRTDATDRVWIAYQGGIVRMIDRGGHVMQFGAAEGLVQKAVLTIYQDRRGEIWVGGQGGISRYHDNRFQTLSFRNQVPRWPVAAIVDDDAGNFWIAFAFYGFLRVEHDELVRALDGSSDLRHYRAYTNAFSAGYPDTSYGGNSGRDRNGALWFLSSRGVTVIDPHELRADAAPIVPRVEGVSADDTRLNASSGIILPPRTNRLRIDYTVIDPSSSWERIRYRYRLDGFDTAWIDGTGLRQASYTNLSPGSYRFRVEASNDLATWTGTEADWDFSIRPMFYQTRWFDAVCAAAFALMLFAAWQIRMRRVKRELAMVFGERLRLSREIHDTLLQGLVGLALQLDALAHDVRDTSSRIPAHLLGMRKQVEEYIREMRQSIWDLRSPSLDQHGLIGALRAAGERLTSGKVQFTLVVTGNPRPCPPKTETHVLRIGHEAVMNAVRHAGARHVRMEIGFHDDLLRLRVVDDGRGFAEEASAIGSSDWHYGLANMRERAADAGGRCVIESATRSGVQVIAEFPLPAAG